MLWSGHESATWRCSLCDPTWRPGPDDPPEAEIWESRNCRHDPPPAGAHLDLPYAPEALKCPRRNLARAMPVVAAYLVWRDTGALPCGAQSPGAIPLRILEAFQALEAGRRRVDDSGDGGSARRELEALQAQMRALGMMRT